MAKLEIPIIVNCTEIDELIDEIKHLQTYKLFEGDEQVLIDRDDTIEIFAKHIRVSAQPKQCIDTIDALNESIKYFDDMAEERRRNANIERNDYMDMRDDAAEYRQLSIWLNELKWLRERFQLKSFRNWIPVSEELPKEDTAVLIAYRYKAGEGDTSHCYIDITSYGHVYFGGRVCSFKEWRAPFEYFHSNYEVVAWMPLPEPYKEEQDED